MLESFVIWIIGLMFTEGLVSGGIGSRWANNGVGFFTWPYDLGSISASDKHQQWGFSLVTNMPLYPPHS